MNFDNRNILLKVDFLERKGKRIIDSVDEKWMGQGSLLPNIIDEDNELSIKPYQFALYKLDNYSKLSS